MADTPTATDLPQKHHNADAFASQQEAKYRALFNSIDEGVAIVEVLLDQQGRVVDMIWREANPAVERQAGISGWVGKRASEMVPHLEQAWLDALTSVYQTGEPVRMEAYSADLDRWIETYYSRVGEVGSPLLVSVFRDITERKQREQQHAFLLPLSDILRTHLIDTAILQQAALQLLAEQIDVMRAIYYEVEPDQDTLTLRARFDRDAVPIPDQLRLSDFPPTVADEYRTGQTQMVTDTENEPYPEAYRAIGIRAWLVVPFVKEGRLVTVVGVHSKRPRNWTAIEVQLVEAFAERTWAAVERARAEEAVRRSEEKYRKIFENIDQGFSIHELIIDESGQVTDVILQEVNEAFEKHTGLKNAQGKKVSEIVPHLEPVWLDAMTRAYKWGETQQFEAYNVDTNRWITSQYSRIGGAGSRLLSTVFTDVTERKQREQRQELMLSIAQELGQLTNENQLISSVGTKLAAHLGLTCYHYVDVDEASNQVTVSHFWHALKVPPIGGTYPLRAFVTPAALDAWRAGKPTIIQDIEREVPGDTPEGAMVKTGAAAQKISAFIAVGLRLDGKCKAYFAVADSRPRAWTKSEIELVQEVAGQLLPRIERARAESALQASQKRFESIANLVPDLLWASDPDGATSWLNQRWLDYTGQRLEEAISWGWTQAIHPDDRAGSAQRYSQAVADGQPLRQEHRIRRHDGAYRWFVVDATPLQDQTGQVVTMYGTATDIHDRKLLEADLLEADRRKDEFLAMLAHELRNPLAPIRNGLQLLGQTHAQDQTLNALLPIMNRQMDHLMRLVDDLLDVSRISRGKIELHTQRIDLVQLIKQTLQAMQPLYAASGRQLTGQLPDYPLCLDGDGTRLNQVVTNLLSNGLRYTHEGGQVWLSLAQLGGQAVLRVKDNGIGLAADQLDAIFGLFVQVDQSLARSHGGLGLGLALVQQLVGLHGGRVEAHSPGLDQGSEFVVYLPVLLA